MERVREYESMCASGGWGFEEGYNDREKLDVEHICLLIHSNEKCMSERGMQLRVAWEARGGRREPSPSQPHLSQPHLSGS